MNRPTRVAFFTDAYREANGVARISQALEAYAARCNLPLLCVHAGPTTRFIEQGSGARLELRRSFAAIRLEFDLSFDPLLWRHLKAVANVLQSFRPDILHITGPSDVGQLGAYLGHRLSIPMVGSWHTNLHQYAVLRSAKWLSWLPASSRLAVQQRLERHTLSAEVLFYQIPRVLMAPNNELVDLLARRTAKPTFLMKHGVDTHLFAPRKRDRCDQYLQIGFVGRLSAEKQVRLLATLEQVLMSAGTTDVRFVVIGDGAERDWLQQHMTTAEFCGVLHGEALARAYANLDLFVFPSESETFGLAILEAMASGVPVIAMAQGGPRYVVEHGVSGLLTRDARAFVDATLALVHDDTRRKRLGAGARVSALAWSWDAMFNRLYEIYRDTVQDEGPP